MRYAIQENGVKTVVLPAFGCGSCKNPPRVVAELYRDFLEKMPKGAFEAVVFAIPDEDTCKIFTATLAKFVPVGGASTVSSVIDR